MGSRTEHAAGTFSWPELCSTDWAAAKTFYTSLFGWDADDQPVGEDSVYTMLSMDGLYVAAMYPMNAEQQASGLPSNWLSYITVDDADATARKAEACGAAVVAAPFDVFDAGRMAIFADPQGANFAIWQANQHIGAQLVNEPGSLCWNELATKDLQAAQAFYGDVFEWTAETLEHPGAGPYTMIKNGERLNGGMLQMTEEWGDMPSHWMVYFAVEDTDVTAEYARQLGGQVCVPPTDIPGTGRFAVINDPQGGAFSIIALIDPDD